MNDPRSAAWDHELAQTGHVRFPIRRRMMALRLVLFTIMLVSAVGTVGSALRGERPWGWWEIFSVVFVLFFVPLIGYTIWRSAPAARCRWSTMKALRWTSRASPGRRSSPSVAVADPASCASGA